jgi:hypothetical protein
MARRNQNLSYIERGMKDEEIFKVEAFTAASNKDNPIAYIAGQSNNVGKPPQNTPQAANQSKGKTPAENAKAIESTSFGNYPVKDLQEYEFI